MSLRTIIKKNLKFIFRSKIIITLTLMIPLLTSLIVGITYDKFQNVPNISVGYYSYSYSPTSYQLINSIKNKGISTIKFDSPNLCKEAIKKSLISGCIIMSPNIDYETNTNNITLIVDYTKIGLAWQIQNIILSAIGQTNRNITTDVTAQLLKQFASTNQILQSQQPLLDKIATTAKIIQSDTISGTSILKNINTYFSPSTFSLSSLNETAQKQKSTTSSLKRDTANKISAVISYLNNINNEINSINLSASKKASLVSSLNSIKSNVNQIQASINTSSENAETYYSDLKNQLNIINANLNQLSSRFSEIENRKNSVSSTLDSIKDSIGKISLNQQKIKDSINELLNEISLINLNSATKIAQPIRTTIQPIAKNDNKINYIFPKMLIILLMFSALILSADFIIYDKKSTAYLRNLFSPTHSLTYIIAHFISEFIIILLEIISLIIISLILLPSFLDVSILSIFIFSLIYSTLFILLGLMIGNLSNSEENTAIISATTGVILLLLSGLFIPLEYLPKNISAIISYNPVVVADNALREITFFNTTINQSLNSIIIPSLILIIEIFIILLVIVFTQGIFEKKKLIIHRRRLTHLKNNKNLKTKIKTGKSSKNTKEINEEKILDYLNEEDKLSNLGIVRDNDPYKKIN
ncbi:MAG: ABC transporter permease, partial [Nitrospiraceae bacterium]|nr:ABC transporter permease [Nitrospiraceae bacterium]